MRLGQALLAAALVIGASFVPSSSQQVDPISIDVLGDSITEQAYGYLGGWEGAPSLDVEKIAGAGWSVDCAEQPYSSSVTANPPDVTVIALGPNDADPANRSGGCDPNNDGGWTLYDLANFYDLLRLTPVDSCVVVVLPRHAVGFPPAWGAQLNEARDDIVDLMAPGGALEPPPDRTLVLADWRMTVAVHPSYLDVSGIHLSGVDSNAPARARQDVYWDGAANC